jgi:hypothetical protein
MTWMSESRCLETVAVASNRAKPRRSRALARRVQRSRAVLFVPLAISLGAAGCIIPPSLSVEKQDASVNSPPAILKVVADTTPLAEAQTVTFVMGTQSQLVLSLVDTDLNETLTARVFVNYTIANPTPPRSQCAAPPNGAAVRADALCSLIALCETADIGKTQDMTVVVFDKMLDDSVPPVFQYDGPDGLSASKFFHLQCMMGT